MILRPLVWHLLGGEQLHEVGLQRSAVAERPQRRQRVAAPLRRVSTHRAPTVTTARYFTVNVSNIITSNL